MAELSLSIYRAVPLGAGRCTTLKKGHGKAEVPPPGWMERTLRGVEWNTSTRCYFSVCNLGCDLGRLLLTRSVGDGRGRADKALGSKPSGLCPKPEDLAERPCRTAALPGTAVGTALARAPANQIWGPPSPALRERDLPRPRGEAPPSCMRYMKAGLDALAPPSH